MSAHSPSAPAPTTAPVRGASISYQHVVKTWPGATHPAVDDVSLAVEPGEFVVLLGPSGCGKTTLLKLTNRLYEPDAGRILVDGQPVDAGPAPRFRRTVGYVIQQAGLFPHWRVGENVAAVPKLLGWAKPRIAARVDELLELVGLPPAQYRDRYPAQLSGGQQQRVGIARALAAEPPMLLMDEPFGALDAITRGRLQEELRRIHDAFGQTVLFVTHDIEEAVRLADRIVVMREGRVVQFDTPLAIVMRPADAAVADLVGADDVLRRLSLVEAGPLARPLPPAAARPPDVPRIPATAMLREALAALLERGATEALVTDAAGTPAGTISLADIQRASVPPAVAGESAP